MMNDQSGGGGSEVSDSEILRMFALSPDPVMSAAEISQDVSISNQAVNKRLNRMVDGGLLNSKKVGSAARVYWLTRDGRSRLAELEE